MKITLEDGQKLTPREAAMLSATLDALGAVEIEVEMVQEATHGAGSSFLVHIKPLTKPDKGESL